MAASAATRLVIVMLSHEVLSLRFCLPLLRHSSSSIMESCVLQGPVSSDAICQMHAV